MWYRLELGACLEEGPRLNWSCGLKIKKKKQKKRERNKEREEEKKMKERK